MVHGVLVLLLVLGSLWHGLALAQAAAAERVILFVLEGVDRSVVHAPGMPVLAGLVKDGAVSWSASGISPGRRLPTMTSVLTGLPVDKHGVTWDAFDFARGFPRAPMVFDYLDLAGGLDSAVFLMDESLYQLTRPEPYVDYQRCGALRPECTPATVMRYIRDYFQKATSGHGYGHASAALPHLLVVHLPPAESATALHTVDATIGSVLQLYRDYGLLPRTTVFVSSLSGGQGHAPATAGGAVPQRKDGRRLDAPRSDAPRGGAVPWIAWGAGIKKGHHITDPVSILDIGPTVLRAFGLDTHTDWEGRAIDDIFVASATTETVTGR
ncbi:hypothetical protein [Candidatus Nitrospira bockiana]